MTDEATSGERTARRSPRPSFRNRTRARESGFAAAPAHGDEVGVLGWLPSTVLVHQNHPKRLSMLQTLRSRLSIVGVTQCK